MKNFMLTNLTAQMEYMFLRKKLPKLTQVETDNPNNHVSVNTFNL